MEATRSTRRATKPLDHFEAGVPKASRQLEVWLGYTPRSLFEPRSSWRGHPIYPRMLVRPVLRVGHPWRSGIGHPRGLPRHALNCLCGGIFAWACTSFLGDRSHRIFSSMNWDSGIFQSKLGSSQGQHDADIHCNSTYLSESVGYLFLGSNIPVLYFIGHLQRARKMAR
jgi:hypothetical protein